MKNYNKTLKQLGITYLGTFKAVNFKINKSLKESKVLTYALSLAPANESGYNVCPFATTECKAVCLASSGNGGMYTNVQKSRIKKTKLFFENRNLFFELLIHELTLGVKKANVMGLKFAVRLNVLSDINWNVYKHNGKTIFEHFPNVQFYDYTKIPKKFDNIPSNYHLTFSYTGYNVQTCENLLERGFNIAVVFNIKNASQLPAEFLGYPVINGDLTDYRPNDKKGTVVGLKFKKLTGKGKNNEKLVNENSKFVVPV